MACIPRAFTASQALPIGHGNYARHCRQVGTWEQVPSAAPLVSVHTLLTCPCPTDPAAVKLEDFPIHAITGVLKQWLRELPEPLMTFAQYGDFLRAVGEPWRKGWGWSISCSSWGLQFGLSLFPICTRPHMEGFYAPQMPREEGLGMASATQD